MLKNAKIASVGDVIRGYDFKPMVGRNDCFVEGDVESITNEMGYMAYKITCTKDVFDGAVQPKGKHSRVGKIVQSMYCHRRYSIEQNGQRIQPISRFRDRDRSSVCFSRSVTLSGLS